MNTRTSFIASAPPRDQARRAQKSRNPEVSSSQQTLSSGTVGRKISASKLASHQSIVNTTKAAPQEALCQLFFLANHRIFQSPQSAKRAVDRFVHRLIGFSTNIISRKTSGSLFLLSGP
jgi:hypothetical protein